MCSSLPKARRAIITPHRSAALAIYFYNGVFFK
jgi:hypothetical protein